MAELEGLQFSVVSENTDKTAASLDRLTASLSGMKTALKGVSTSGLTKGLKAINEALSNTDNETISKLKQLGDAGNALQRLSGVRISASIAKQISAIADATAKLTGDSISKVDDLASALTKLNDIKAPKITVKTPKATDELKKSSEDASRSNTDKVGGGNERDTEQENVPKSPTSVDTKYWTDFSRKVDVTTNALNKFLDVGMKARSAFINLGKGALDAGKQIGDKLTAGFRNAANTASQFMHSIGRIALYRAIRSAIKAVTEGLQEGIQNLYQWSNLADGSFASSMDRLATSAQYLKNSFAAMAAPLINALAPAIDFIIDKLVSLMNVINQVFAVLTGAKTWTKALKAPAKYADAATGSTKKATKAAKEYKNQLMGFDELNRLEAPEQSSPSGGGGGGGGGVDYGSMFTQEPISDKIKKWLKTDDWTGLGKEVAQKANKVLVKVDDWFTGTLEPFLNTWAKRIGTFINGFVDDFNWELLGKTIADGLNAVVRPLNTFLTTVNWENLGRGFARAVDGIFRNADWAAYGQLIGSGLNVIIDTFHGFITEFSKNAYSYGLDFATAINNVFSTIHWKKLGEDIVLGVQSLRDILNGLNDGIKWDKIKQDIDEGLNYAIRNVDAAGLAKAASDLIMNVLDVLGSIDWYALGVKVGEFIANIDWSGILSKVIDGIFRFVAGYIKGSFSGDGVLFNSIVFGIPLLKGAINLGSDAIKNYAVKKALGMSDPIGDAIKNGIKGLNPSIVGGIAGIGVGLPMYIFSLKDAVSNGLDLLNGATITAGSTMAGAGVGAIIGSLGGPIGTGIGALIGLAVGLVTDGVVYITQHASEIKEKLSDIWNAVKDKASEIWTGITTTVGDLWDGLKTKAGDVFNTISTTVGNVWDSVKSKTSEVWNGITSTLSDTWTNIKSSASDTWANLKSTIATKWDEISGKTTSIWDAIKGKLSDSWNNMKNDTSNSSLNMSNTMASMWGAINNKSNNSMNALIRLITNGNASNLGDIGRFVSSSIAKAAEMARDFIGNIRSGLSNLRGTIQNIMNSAVQPITSIVNSASHWGSDLIHNIASGIRNAASAVTSAVSNVASDIKSMLHFSEPDVGPLADFHTWPIDMMKGFASGIESNSHYITDALNGLTANMQMSMEPAINAETFTTQNINVPNGNNAVNATDAEADMVGFESAIYGAILQAINNSDTDNGDQKVVVQIDGKEVFNAVVSENNRSIMRTGRTPLKT